MSELLQGDLVRNGSLATIGLAGLLVTYYISRPKNRVNGAPISDFPGPEKKFIVGDLKNLPSTNRSATFTKWQREYGLPHHFNFCFYLFMRCRGYHLPETALSQHTFDQLARNGGGNLG
jgi:hypothetical protein